MLTEQQRMSQTVSMCVSFKYHNNPMTLAIFSPVFYPCQVFGKVK